VFLSLLVQSCRTNPPDSPEIPDATGLLYITSNVPGAAILLNNNQTGRVTPDSIEVTPGNYTVKLELDGYKPASQTVTVTANQIVPVGFTLEQSNLLKTVLLEDFANVSCQPCVVSNAIIKSLSESSYTEEELVVIKYPTNFPSPSDPFYLANPSACDERIGFYTVFSAPTVVVDGIEKPSPTDSIAIKQVIDQQLSVPSKFLLSVTDTIAGGQLDAAITIEVIDTSGIDFSRLAIFAAVTETDIFFDTPPGSNGETKFYHVFRAMLLGNSGTAMINYAAPGTYTLNPSVQTDTGWQADKLHTIVFIQNTLTKEVYQAAVSK
jgi:hypothetical protein